MSIMLIKFTPTTISKLQYYIFLLLIFLLPTQLGKHFWPSWSLVNGVRIDYLSPTIYATDILIFILLILELVNQKFKLNIKTKIPAFAGMTIIACLIVFSIRINPLEISINPLSLIKLIKIIEIIVFAWIVKTNLNKKNYHKFILVLSFSLLFESILAILQFFNHGSLNGIFYWFGERNFSSGTPGIANAVINGSLILRPYGTLPHPNVLAGYLLVGIILVMQNLNLKMKNDNVKFKINHRLFFLFVVVISSIALMLTMSRVTIVLWVVFILFNLKFKIKNLKLSIRLFVYSLILIFVIILLSPRFLSIFGEDKESYIKRIQQSEIAISMIKDHPLFGVGLNQYLVNLPKYFKNAGYRDYQPVHSVFLLFIAETGLAGILLVLFCLWRLGFLRIKNLSFLPRIKLRDKLQQESYLIIAVFILSFFDHYFYTTQQGNLMIGLVLGLLNSKFKYRNSKQ